MKSVWHYRHFGSIRLAVFGVLGLFWVHSASCEGPIKIGWSGPLSGPSAVLGLDSLKAVTLAVEQANAAGGIAGRPIKLLAEDDQYDTAKAVSAYRRLVAQGVAAIIASTYGGVFATAKPALHDGVIIIDPLDCNEAIAALEENTFCLATRSESIGQLLAAHVRSSNNLPLAIIVDQSNPFMTLLEAELRKAVGSSQIYTINTDPQGDLNSELIRLRARNTRAIAFLGHDPMGLAMRAARNLGVRAQFYTLGTITSPGYRSLAGDAAEGALVAYWEAPRTLQYRAFISAFVARFGGAPVLELASIPSFDAACALFATLRSVVSRGAELDVLAIRGALQSYVKPDGVSGVLRMDADGAVRSINEHLYRYAGGALRELSSAGAP